MSEDSFSEGITNFLDEHTPAMQVATQSEEQDLRSYEVFKDFLAMMEGLMHEFQLREGITAEEFRDQLQADMAEELRSVKFLSRLRR